MRFSKTQEFINKILKLYEEQTLTNECIFWPYANNGGYGNFNRNKKQVYVHRKILSIVTKFDYDNEFEAAHSCGNSLCVNPLHLSWKTTSENEKDKIFHNTLRFGDKHHNKTLTSEDVSNIRRLRLNNSLTFREIAEIYDIDISYAIRINSGKARKHDGKI